MEDLVLDRPDAPVTHIVQSIGGRDRQRSEEFAKKYCPNSTPNLYDNYEQVYNDPNVDVVYIGTPHAFHKQNMLDAIAAGKNILCEKAFTINAQEAREVLEAAKAKNVYVHEVSFLTPATTIHSTIAYQKTTIGDVASTPTSRA